MLLHQIINNKIQLLHSNMYPQTTIQWLLTFLVPFVILTLFHVFIPMLFLTQPLPKAETMYNQFKLTSEQTSLQSKGILSAQIVKNRLQTFQNIRESEIDIFLQNDTQYINLNYSAIHLNFAGDTALETASKQTLMKSMWFTENVSGLNDLNLLQLQYLNKFKNIEKLIEASLVQNDSRHLPQIQMVLDNPKMYFAFPSAYDSKFQNNSYDVFDAQYLQIKNHYYQTGEQYLIFKEGTSFKLCNILLTKNRQDKGTFCFIINSKHLAGQLKQVTKTSIDISTVNYYFMKPYNYPNQTESEVIFKFSNQNQQVNYTDNYFIQISDTIREYFNPTYSYKFFFKQYTASSEYIIAPVEINDIHQNSIICYFLIAHYFKQTDFTPFLNISSLILILFLPSLGMTIFFSILLAVLMKCLHNSLQQGAQRLNQCCSHILNGDLKINIPEYHDTEELRVIYCEFQIINELYRISSQKFYEGTPQQVLFKYLQVLPVFKKFQYDTSSLSQIIGNCYYNLHDHDNAAIHYEQSIFQHWKQLQITYDQSLLDIIKNYKQHCKKSYSFKYSIKSLKRKYFKFFLSIQFPTLNPAHIEKVGKHFKCYKKITCNKDRICKFHLSYLAVETRYNLVTNDIEKAERLIQQYESILKRLMNKKEKASTIYENSRFGNPYAEIQLALSMYADYGKFMRGTLCFFTNRYADALRWIVDSMEYSNQFRPQIAEIKINFITMIFKKFDMLTPSILQTVYFKDHYYHREAREVFMIFQWTILKKSSVQRANAWKKTAIDKAKKIFKTLQDNDRLSVIKFDNYTQSLGSLTKMKTCRRLLLHCIEQLAQSQLQRVKPNIESCLKQIVQRIKKLREVKYLMFFIRDDIFIERKRIQPLLEGVKNIKVLFMQFGKQLKGQKSHKYFLFSGKDEDTLDRIFSHKQQNQFYNTINPF